MKVKKLKYFWKLFLILTSFFHSLFFEVQCSGYCVYAFVYIYIYPLMVVFWAMCWLYLDSSFRALSPDSTTKSWCCQKTGRRESWYGFQKNFDGFALCFPLEFRHLETDKFPDCLSQGAEEGWCSQMIWQSGPRRIWSKQEIPIVFTYYLLYLKGWSRHNGGYWLLWKPIFLTLV